MGDGLSWLTILLWYSGIELPWLCYHSALESLIKCFILTFILGDNSLILVSCQFSCDDFFFNFRQSTRLVRH